MASQRHAHSAKAAVVALAVVTLVGGLAGGLGGGVAANAADSTIPITLPALAAWHAGGQSFTFSANTSITIDTTDQGLAREASTFVGDLDALTKVAVPVTSGTPAPGDIQLSVDPARKDLGAEGYQLSVDGSLKIVGNTDAGVFYGTRTVLQLLQQSATIVGGSTTDIPAYPERGLGIAMITGQFSPKLIERTIRELAYVKMNQLQVEVKVKSEKYPKVNSWAYLTRDQAREIKAVADQYHVDLITEINGPGHMAPYIAGYPEFQLSASPTSGNIGNPALSDFVLGLAREQLSVLPNSTWHMGADEFDYSPGVMAELAQTAKDQLGPNATVRDLYYREVRAVQNGLIHDGVTPRMWNDGIQPDELQLLPQQTIIEHWASGDGLATPQQILDSNHRLLNVSWALYMIRPINGVQTAKAQTLYDAGWNPLIFDRGLTVKPNNPNLLGARVTVWQDDILHDTERSVEKDIVPMVQFTAQATWGTPKPDATYAQFSQRAATIGQAPGYLNEDLHPVAAGTYVVSTNGGNLTTTDPSRVTLSSTEPTWQLTRTADGLYEELRSGGECLSIGTTLTQVLQFSAPLSMTTCGVGTSTQFQLDRSGKGYVLRSASSQMPLRIENGVLVQRPADQAPPSVWTFTDPNLPKAANDSGKVTAGKSVTIPVLRNDTAGASGVPLDATSVRLVDPNSAGPVTSVTAPGKGKWSVDPRSGDVTFTADSNFAGVTTIDYTVKDAAGKQARATITVTTTAAPTTPPKTGGESGSSAIPAAPVRSGGLADTGSDIVPAIIAAGLAVGLGGLFVAIAFFRRRRRAG